MKLSHLTDTQLFIDTKNLVKLELKTTAEILWYLKEIDERRLYSDYKCTSLFDFCVRVLGYSEGSASRRITAARLLKKVPEIMTKIQDGSLSLTNINLISKEIKVNPKSDIKMQTLKLATELSNKSSREAEKIIFQHHGSETIAKPKYSIKQVSVTQKNLTVTLNNDTIDRLEKLKSLLSNKNLKSIDEVLDFAIKTCIEKCEEKYNDKREYKQKSINTDTRIIPAKIKRLVMNRDHRQCTKCGSKNHLHLDHIRGFALGGKTTAGNLRILCSNCNQRARVRMKL